MKKYSIEFIGTFLFVVSIIGIVYNASALVAIHIGLALTALVYMGGAISGAHYNPAVTFGVFLNKKIGARDAVGYIVSQLLGAVIAFLVMTKGLNISLPPVGLFGDTKSFFIAELIFTFALVTTVLHTAVNRLTAGNSYFGLAIGAIVIVGGAAVGKISGGFFNPAVLLGIGLFGIPTNAVIAILGGQLVGAFGAAWLYRYVIGK
jgi:aquaporin Z